MLALKIEKIITKETAQLSAIKCIKVKAIGFFFFLFSSFIHTLPLCLSIPRNTTYPTVLYHTFYAFQIHFHHGHDRLGDLVQCTKQFDHVYRLRVLLDPQGPLMHQLGHRDPSPAQAGLWQQQYYQREGPLGRNQKP